MKALFYELQGPRNLTLRDEELAEGLGPGELLARTEFSAISPGTELAAWSGKPPLRPSVVYPRLVGYLNVAQIIAVGEGTMPLAVGQYILTHQSHRSAFRCDVADVLLALEQHTELQRKHVTATYLYHLPYSALLSAGFTPGHDVAIVGFGALGLAAAQLVQALGGTPIVFTGRPEAARADLRGPASILPKQCPGPQQMSELTGMDGVDIVINTSDAWSDHLLSLQVARLGATVVCLGFPGRGLASPDFNPLDSRYTYDKQLTIRHSGKHTPHDGPPVDLRFSLKRNLRFLESLIQSGRLDPTVLLGEEAPFDTLARIYENLSTNSRRSYSTVLRWPR